jgi:hypothetical protein
MIASAPFFFPSHYPDRFDLFSSTGLHAQFQDLPTEFAYLSTSIHRLFHSFHNLSTDLSTVKTA